MRYSNSAILLATASLPAASEAKAYIFAQTKSNSYNHCKEGSSVYAGYCVDCTSWRNDHLSSADASVVVNRDRIMVSTSADDKPIRRSVMHLTEQTTNELPLPPMEMKLPNTPTITLSNSNDATEDFIMKAKASVAHQKEHSSNVSDQQIMRTFQDEKEKNSDTDQSFMRQLASSFLLLGVAATAYVTTHKHERRKLRLKTPKKGSKVDIPAVLTDLLTPDLAPATPLSLDMPDQEQEEKISKLKEENQFLRNKIEILTAMERSITENDGDCSSASSSKKEATDEDCALSARRSISSVRSMDKVGNESDWENMNEDYFPGSPTMDVTSTLEILQNQVNELKEELKETKERLQKAMQANTTLNDAHDRKHEELEALKSEMNEAWLSFEDTYASQLKEINKVEGRNRKLISENEDLKASNRDLAAKIGRMLRRKRSR
jgi:DNA repair exonuclease SbcCD ATPase subunit